MLGARKAFPNENAYKALFRDRVVRALNAAKAAASVTHAGVRGAIRETLVSELLAPLLPADIGIGSGQIVEARTGRQSRQQDLILYDKSILPPITFENNGIVPVEAVLYTIEVKSKLTREELRKAHEAAKELKSFELLSGQFDDRFRPVQHEVVKPVCVLLALETDLSGKGDNDAERYIKHYGSDGPHLSAITVAGRGHWFYYTGVWVEIKANLEGEEVLFLLSSIMNGYREIAVTRRWPRLGNYLMDGSNEMEMFPEESRAAIKIKCPKCGHNGMTVLNPRPASPANYPRGFNSGEPCPFCGVEMVAPPGTYVLVRGLLTLQK